MITAYVIQEGQRGFLYRDGVLVDYLRPGRHVRWNPLHRYRLELHTVEALVIPLTVDQDPFAVASVTDAVLLEIASDMAGLVWLDGVPRRVLRPGRYFSFLLGGRVAVAQVGLADLDSAIPLEFVAHAGPKLVEVLDSLRDAVYAETQLATRYAVAGVTVDGLLEQRTELAAKMIARVRGRAHDWGVEILSLDVKDVILPGEMKVLLNRVIEAEKRAAAQVILRREEVAATRSLANTARLLEQNPVLQRLKELEGLKELAERIPKLTVVVGSDQVTKHLRLGED